MATSSRHLCRTVIQASRTFPAKRRCTNQQSLRTLSPARTFTSSYRRCADDNDRPSQPIAAQDSSWELKRAARFRQDTADKTLRIPRESVNLAELGPQAQAEMDYLTPEQQEQMMGLLNHQKAIIEDAEETAERQMPRLEAQIARFNENNPLPISHGQALAKELGYWGDDEEDEMGRVEDDDDDMDESMITQIAESELNLHREIREYMRVAAWDMPLLSQYAKPFEAPTSKTPLRFRYTTYMGEYHPAQKKVVVEFTTKDLAESIKLSEAQRVKLIKLVGVRYNPSSDIVRMSCEKFEHATQNKRYLGDMIDKLVAEAKDDSDMFEDIPLDFRHHKEKKKPEYPDAWKMTKGRVEELDLIRQLPLKQLAAAQEAQEMEQKKENESQRRIAEYAMAQQLGRREPSSYAR